MAEDQDTARREEFRVQRPEASIYDAIVRRMFPDFAVVQLGELEFAIPASVLPKRIDVGSKLRISTLLTRQSTAEEVLAIAEAEAQRQRAEEDVQAEQQRQAEEQQRLQVEEQERSRADLEARIRAEVEQRIGTEADARVRVAEQSQQRAEKELAQLKAEVERSRQTETAAGKEDAGKRGSKR